MGESDSSAGVRAREPGRRGALAPVLEPILRRRALTLGLAMAGSAQVAFALGGLPGMPCPFLHLFHVPCPGCGGTRACVALLHGQWGQSLQLHAFAPFFLMAIGMFWLASLLPAGARGRLANWMGRLERRSALPTLLLILLFLYWVARLLYPSATFAQLAIS